jgi:hypothetical protein
VEPRLSFPRDEALLPEREPGLREAGIAARVYRRSASGEFQREAVLVSFVSPEREPDDEPRASWARAGQHWIRILAPDARKGPMDLELKDKAAIVIGGTQGIGRATAMQ